MHIALLLRVRRRVGRYVLLQRGPDTRPRESPIFAAVARR